MNKSVFDKSIQYLERDVFKNLHTLKYLTEYRDHSEIRLLESDDKWALSVSVPTAILSYDTVTYPRVKTAVFINGNSPILKQKILQDLPNDNYVLRLSEEIDLSRLEDRFHIQKTNTFISFSCTALEHTCRDIVAPNPEVSNGAVKLIMKNDYAEAEIRQYFENGAVWFGYFEDKEIASICFVYPNYGNIWEIAGLRTLEPYRNRGYGRIVVSSALKYLLERKRVPRYNLNDKNVNSIKLALSLKLQPFLKIEHFLLNQQSQNIPQ